LGHHFVVRTDHYNLKYLLDQRLSTVPQHQWLSKLFGFDFEVEYRPGCLNVAADALSRRDAELLQPAAREPGQQQPWPSLGLRFAFLDDISRATTTSPDSSRLCQQLQDGTLTAPLRLEDGLLHGSRVYVPNHDDLRH
jgi:hypothetical protein